LQKAIRKKDIFSHKIASSPRLAPLALFTDYSCALSSTMETVYRLNAFTSAPLEGLLLHICSLISEFYLSSLQNYLQLLKENTSKRITTVYMCTKLLNAVLISRFEIATTTARLLS